MSEPLLLVPGLGCTAELFAPQWARLGVGRAVMVAEHRLDASLGAIAERTLAAAPPRFALCGLSMGGYIAFELMRRAPERVTKLALLDTSAKPATPETNAMRLEMIALAQGGHYGRVLDMQWRRLVAASRQDDAELRAIVRRMAEIDRPDVFERQQRAIMGRPDSRLDLASIAVPALVLVGAEDVITPPADAQEIAAGIKGSELVVVPACGHLATLEAPDAVTDALERWLATD
jgi:pimeloyl-ACP methyl ester carboxylesterase